MVRLKVAFDGSLIALSKAFQFLNGAIKSKKVLQSKVNEENFNSLMVRLKVVNQFAL